MIGFMILVVATGMVFTLIMVMMLKTNEPPKGTFKSYLKIMGVFSSICWVWLLSDLLVSMIKSLHIIFNYHYVYMMIGIFSFLEWVPLALGSLRVVRILQDMPGYSAVVFNGLFVFGISIVIQSFMFDAMPVQMYPRVKSNESFHLFIYILMVAFTCVVSWFLL
jgi:hypothetical protein